MASAETSAIVSIPCQSNASGLACQMDTFGRYFLREASASVLGLVCVVLVLILAAIRRFAQRRKLILEDLIKVFLGLLGIATGLTVAAVFLLTNPPAFDELSKDSLAVIGGVVLIVLCGLGLNEVTAFLSMKNRRGLP